MSGWTGEQVLSLLRRNIHDRCFLLFRIKSKSPVIVRGPIRCQEDYQD